MARYTGTSDRDVLLGSAEADVMIGLDGDDDLSGFGGNDALSGGFGDDVLRGGAGRNTLSGGFGLDTISYADAVAAMVIDMRAGRAVGSDRRDTFTGVEAVIGSDFADVISGSDNADRIYGGNGDDTVAGGGGSDTLDGGEGYDTLTYAASAYGVTIYLQPGFANSEGDAISGFEALVGSDFADALSGDNAGNAINGGAGNDLLLSSGGADTLDGGNGFDIVSYYNFSRGVTIDLAVAGPQGKPNGGTDTLVNMEGIAGSLFGDRLSGNDGFNIFYPEAGSDVIDGRGGFDYVSYDTASQATGVVVDLVRGRATSGAERDTLIGIEGVFGSAFDDRIVGNEARNGLYGRVGADTLTGGAGADIFVYDATMESAAGLGIDTITDFADEDQIDLRLIDADIDAAGDQAFVLTNTFHGVAGELTLAYDRGSRSTVLNADVDGDALADLTIILSGKVTAVMADNWLL